MPAKFISSAFEVPAASAGASSKKNSRKPDWMKQHRCRPNMPNKESTDKFIDELQTELEAAKVRLHTSSVVDFTRQEEVQLQNIREKRSQVKYDLELAQEDLADLKYDRESIKLDLEAVEAQLEEMVLHEASLKNLIDQTGPRMDQECFDEISSYQAMVNSQHEEELLDTTTNNNNNRSGAVSASPSEALSEGDEDSLRALGWKTANILHEFSQEHSSSSTSAGNLAQQFSYGLTWSSSAIDEAPLSSGAAVEGEHNTDFVHPTWDQFANAQRLTAFYLRYAPEKVVKVWEALQMYAGREETLFEELEAHYCPEGLCSTLQHYKKAAKQQEEATPVFDVAADPYSSSSYCYDYSPSIGDSAEGEIVDAYTPGPTTSTSSADVLLHKEPELYQPSHGLSLNSRQKLAQAALPEVGLQIHALQLNVKGLKCAIDAKNRELKLLNRKINSLQAEKKQLEKRSGALYYQYAGPSEASRKREKSNIQYLESRIAKTIATFEAESVMWEEWVKEAQAAYRKKHNLSEDFGLAYPGMAPVLVSRGSLKEAIVEQVSSSPQSYLSAPPAGLVSRKKKSSTISKRGSNDEIYDDDDDCDEDVEGVAMLF